MARTPICSIEAGQLAPEDAAVYNPKAKVSDRRADVEFMLRDAIQERKAIIQEVQRLHPGVIDDRGVFERDKLAAKFAKEQEELDFEKQKEAKARSKKPSPAGVPAKEQPKSPKKAASRTAAPKGKRAAAPKDKVSKTVELQAKGTRRATKKSAEAAPKNKPVRQEQEVQAEREVEQPSAVEVPEKLEPITKAIELAQTPAAIEEALISLFEAGFLRNGGAETAATKLASATLFNHTYKGVEPITDLELHEGTMRDALRDTFVKLMSLKTKPLYTKLKAGQEKGGKREETVWATFAFEQGLIPRIHEVTNGAPRHPSARIEEVTQTVTNKSDVADEGVLAGVGASNAPNAAAQEIYNILTIVDSESHRNADLMGVGVNKDMRDSLTTRLMGVIKNGKAVEVAAGSDVDVFNNSTEIAATGYGRELGAPVMANMDATYAGVPLSVWFPDNKVVWEKVGARWVLTRPEKATPSTAMFADMMSVKEALGKDRQNRLQEARKFRKESEEIEEEEAAAKRLEGAKGRNKIFETNTNKPITKTMSHGAIKMFVSRAMKRFSKKLRPRVLLYTSIEQFKQKNPKVYQEAMASRSDVLTRRLRGELPIGIPENAAAFAYGDTVVIFSDNIVTKQQLAFTLFHEVVGHHGLAAIMSQAELDAIMENIYESDSRIRAEADRHMSLFGLSKTEATEEAVADFAAELETNVLFRLIAAIRNFLQKKLEFQFDDDMARYFIYQSKRYLRNGTVGDMSPLGVHNRIAQFQEHYAKGRASRVGTVIYDSSIRAHPAPTGAHRDRIIDRATAGVERLANEFKDTKLREGSIRAIRRVVGTVLEEFQSLSNRAQRSPGLAKLYKHLHGSMEMLRDHQNVLAAVTEYLHAYNIMGWGPGPAKEDIYLAGEMNSARTTFLAHELDDETLNNAPLLGKVDANGQFVIDDKALEDARKYGRISREDMEKGFKFEKVGDDGESTGEFELWKPSTKITDDAWKAYQQSDAGVREAALILLRAEFEGHTASKRAELTRATEILGKDLTPEDEATIAHIARIHAEVYSKNQSKKGGNMFWSHDSMRDADSLMYHMLRVLDSKHGTDKVNDWENGSNDPKNAENDKILNDYRETALLKPLIPKLEALSRHNLSTDKIGDMTRTLKNLVLLDGKIINAELKAKKNIMTRYVPFNRTGKIQVSLHAIDESGARVKLHPNLEGKLHYARVDNEKQAEYAKRELEKVYGDIESLSVIGADGNPVNVKFRVAVSEVDTSAPLGHIMDYNAFTQMLVKLNINLTDAERERVITSTTSHNSMARHHLKRTGNPGWDPDVARGVLEHIDMQAHSAAKVEFQYRIDNLMAKESIGLWLGDMNHLTMLQEELAATKNEAEWDIKKRELDKYTHMMVESSDEERIPVLMPNGDTKYVKGKGKHGRYRKTASDIVMMYNNNVDIVDTLDTKVDKYTNRIMSWAAILQLGMSPATALINMTALGTHAIPLLATYNRRTGYGGGFGLGRATAGITRAMKDMGNLRLGNVKDLKEIVEKKTWAQNGFESQAEAEFVYEETLRGGMAPNTTNAMLAAHRRGRHANVWNRGTELWMAMFAKSEQFNRRAVGVAAYRLERQRLLDSGEYTAEQLNDQTSEGSQRLYDFSMEMVNSSQGNYALFNRPAWARQGIGKVLYTYKHFVVITMELMRNLAPKERAVFLAALVVLSGLKGLPFAEDLADIIDTLKQKFELDWDDVEVNINQFAAMIHPKLPRLLMFGLMNYITGATFSTRIGQGNILPGTNYFKAGSDEGREMKDMLGPVASAVEGMIKSMGLAANYATEVVGLKPDKTTLADISRAGLFGATGLKSIADALVFASDGVVTDKRGRILANDISVFNVLTRMLGFYPDVATRHYASVRLGNSAIDYAKEIKSGFTDAARKAHFAGDRAMVNKVKQDVREWNRSVGPKSPLRITKFSSSLSTSIKEGSRTPSGRLAESAPKSAKGLVEEVSKYYGFNAKGNPLSR